MAKLSDAPFIKVEATKFTEVGFHGRDVDSIIRDLVDISIALTKKLKTEKLQEEVAHVVEDKILGKFNETHLCSHKTPGTCISQLFWTFQSVCPPGFGPCTNNTDALIGAHAREDSRQSFRLLLRLGNLDEREIEVTLVQFALSVVLNQHLEKCHLGFGFCVLCVVSGIYKVEVPPKKDQGNATGAIAFDPSG
jgi:ATP-dependent protease HslVU (ClpYQ) ATPase subunit